MNEIKIDMFTHSDWFGNDIYVSLKGNVYCMYHFDDIKYLIMAGGTGIAWYPYFKERLKDIPLEVIAGNQNSNLPGVYSNARGYYMYRLNQLKAKR